MLIHRMSCPFHGSMIKWPLYLSYSGSTAATGQHVVLLPNMTPVDTMSGVIQWNQLKFSLNYAKKAKLMVRISTETRWLSVIKFSQSTVSSPYQSLPQLARYRFVQRKISNFQHYRIIVSTFFILGGTTCIGGFASLGPDSKVEIKRGSIIYRWSSHFRDKQESINFDEAHMVQNPNPCP